MKGAFTCPHCFTQNACDCETCKPFIKEGEYVNKWDKTGSYHICGKCGMSYSPDESLDAEYKLNQKEMTKPFIIANVREIIDCWEHFDPEGYSFSKMVELLNEKAAEYYNQELAKERERVAKLVEALEVIKYLTQNVLVKQKIKQSIYEYRGLPPETTGNQTAC